MKTIWKSPLEITDRQTIQMQPDAEILTVQVQNGVPCIWAHVDPEQPMAVREILTVGTGHPAPDEIEGYIGTYQTYGGQFVWHVFG